jgi:signal transduction histidine kinase
VIARRLTWALLVAGALAAVAAPVFGALAGHLADVAGDLPLRAGFYATGVLAFVLRRDHKAARRLLALGALFMLGNAVGAGSLLLDRASGMPSGAWLEVLAIEVCEWAVFACWYALIAVFPDGAYQRRYERGLLVGFVALLPAALVLQLLGSSRLSTGEFVWSQLTVPNPVSVPGLSPLGAAASVVIRAEFLSLVLAAIVLVLRYRRFGPQQRQQIKWPLYALGITAAFFALLTIFGQGAGGFPDWAKNVTYYTVVMLVPVTLAIAIVRYRLLDIELVIRRSLVYGVLWLLIAGGYVGVAAAFGIAVGQRVPLGLAIVLTIAATLVVQPVRRRLEVLADRVVFGRRLTGYELISQLGARLEASPASEDVAGTVAVDVRRGLDCRWVRVTLTQPEPRPLAAAGISLDDQSEPEISAPLVHRHQVVGTIECGPRREGRYSSADRDLLTTLGRQATLAIRNSQLAAELSEKLQELAASRTRLVQAEEAGRRRIERDIHDGVQQELVAALARLALARNQLRRDRDLAEATLREVYVDGQRALDSLQELVRGIHPPVLTDRGLVEAVRERASRLPVPVEVSSNGFGQETRLPPAVEGAAYFFVSEALANVLKHADASSASVRFHSEPEGLEVEVEDDGRGFSAGSSQGSGLRGLQDRIEALGGRVEVTGRSGRGTRVRARIPRGGTAGV